MSEKPEIRYLAAFFLTIIVATLGLIHKAEDADFVKTFVGFSKIEWSELGACEFTIKDAGEFPKLARTVTWSKEHRGSVVECVSDWFPAKGNFLLLEYAAYKSPQIDKPLYFEIEGEASSTKIKVQPKAGIKQGTWRQSAHWLEDFKRGEKLRIWLVDEDTVTGWLSLRARASFFEVPSWASFLRSVGKYSPKLFRLLFVAGLIGIVCLLLPLINSFSSAFVFSFLLATLVHFRFDIYFWYDDLIFFNFFREHGWKGIFERHHEHFIPVFSALAYLQNKMFGGSFSPYHLVILLLHSLNCALLWLLVKRLDGSSYRAAVIACVVFACSWLQTASLQWITCQSIQLSITFRLMAFLLALSYLKKASFLCLSGVFAASILGMFSYAGGVSIWLELICFVFIFGEKGNIRRFFVAGAASISAAVGALFYFLVLSGAELRHPQVSMSSLEQIWELLRFAFFGSHYGTLARGLSVDFLYDYFPTLGARDLSFSFAGVILALALLTYCLRRKDGSWRYWLFGELLLLMPFVLIGIGRVRWGGIEYALRVRYHTVPLIGLCLLLLPLLRRVNIKSYLMLPILFIWLCLQLAGISGSRYYSDNAFYTKSYAEQLKNWNKTLSLDVDTVFNIGEGTEYEGLYPLPYWVTRRGNVVSKQPTAHPFKLYWIID